MDVKNRVALVTGGAHGIGRALCRALHIEGAQVAVADLDSEQAKKVAGEIGGLAIGLDVSREADLVAAIEKVERELGPIDIFVSNAGVAFGDGPGGAASAPDRNWKACLEVNLMAHVYAARAMVPRMKQRGGGCLVNVASAAGLLCQVGEAAYTASKHAAVGFAESLAITHKDDGIHVCLVCPQAVATRMIGVDEDTELEDGSTGFGGNDVDGILSSEYVADCILAGIQQERFLILPHPQVSTYFQRKAMDHDRWISGMRRFRRKIGGETE
ncbi:MAG: SDR family oxidoreductase [Xanthomonadales bacterium]|nr:SDR family oxidoreductase [Gammaproteobacteria bacterium]NND56085.1 SDR family oxidoreductase [Xanthomonadales bacterium]NNK50216.1 SDR family oxidoreductase [Xanthomonadales bacterium]